MVLQALTQLAEANSVERARLDDDVKIFSPLMKSREEFRRSVDQLEPTHQPVGVASVVVQMNERVVRRELFVIGARRTENDRN